MCCHGRSVLTDVSVVVVQASVVFACYTVTIVLCLVASPIDNRIVEKVTGISSG